ncbi:sel1 repeat family protein [Pelomyxa schiedti]|nr:sel1 repeat family protein [Pelomyxa schiedti]
MADVVLGGGDALGDEVVDVLQNLNSRHAREVLERVLLRRPLFIPALLALRVIAVYFPAIVEDKPLSRSPTTDTFIELDYQLEQLAKNAPSQEQSDAYSFFYEPQGLPARVSSAGGMWLGAWYLLKASWLHYVQHDPTAAAQCAMKSASLGYGPGQYFLAVCYQIGEGVIKNTPMALKLCRDAAGQNLPRAQWRLGNIYEVGDLVEQNLNEAARLYEIAATGGCPEAMCCLGLFYEKGTVVAKDISRAIAFYRQAANYGSSRGLINLGVSYYEGSGVEENVTKAANLFRGAADQGSPEAQCFLGACYNHGKGVEKNLTEAVRWYQKAAAQDHARALCWLGMSYERGEGVPVDQNQALKLYTRAADQRLPIALFCTADCWFRGVGATTPDTRAAFKLALLGEGQKHALCTKLAEEIRANKPRRH